MSSPSEQTYESDKTTGHPAGLYVLFGTEMWERLSYYGMRALLSIYMVAKVSEGGFGWDQKFALNVYGMYTALVYLTPIAGGWLADNYLGQRRSVMIGGVLMVIGHFLMAVPGPVAFFVALSFLVVGNGFFKPNISTIVGGLYRPGDARRDGAFTIFYMGINIGAFLSGTVVGPLGEKVGWHWGFGSAGVGMLLGVLMFSALAKRTLGNLGMAPLRKVEVANGPVVEKKPLTREERQRIWVIVILAAFVVVFWAAFEQAGGLFNIYTKQKVDRMLFGWEVPATVFQSLNPAFIVILGPLFSMLWTYLGRTGKDPSIPTKMGLGILFASLGFVVMLGAAKTTATGEKAAMWWLFGVYFVHTVGELCLSPVGLSMVSKLAPPRLTSLLMGTWFLANFLANWLAGQIGGYAEQLGEFQLFGAIAATTAVFGALLLLLAPTLKKMMHGADVVVPGGGDGHGHDEAVAPVAGFKAPAQPA